MINKKIFTLSMVLALGLAVAAQAAVTGMWSNVGNNYKFNVTSTSGNVTSLELSFAAAAGSNFQINFDENLFDSDGLIGGSPDSFLLFPASVTSPGATQAKTSSLLQAAFTGFTPFAAKDVAQLIVTGTPGTPIGSNIARDPNRLGTAVIETIAGDPNSRQEFPILGGAPPVLPTVADLNITQNTLGETVTGQVALTNVDTLGFVNVNAPQYVPLIPGKTLELPFLPTLSNTGAFSWNTNGAKRGTYAWAITGTNAAGNDGGVITVNVTQVPEPATLSLIGLALVGFVGCARRRS